MLTMRGFVCIVVFLFAGCAFKQVGAPVCELSAQKQRVFARAVERAISRLRNDTVSTGKPFVHFNPTERKEGQRLVQERLPGASALPVVGGGTVTIQPQLPFEENYIAERIRESLVRSGVSLTDRRDEADFIVYTLLFSSGTATTMRELSYTLTLFLDIVFFYSEELEHSVHLLVIAYDKKGGRFINLLDGKAVAKDVEVFLMKVYGPKISTVREDR